MVRGQRKEGRSEKKIKRREEGFKKKKTKNERKSGKKEKTEAAKCGEAGRRPLWAQAGVLALGSYLPKLSKCRPEKHSCA